MYTKTHASIKAAPAAGDDVELETHSRQVMSELMCLALLSLGVVAGYGIAVVSRPAEVVIQWGAYVCELPCLAVLHLHLCKT